MILLVDIGNSNIVLGFSDGEKIVDTYRLKTTLNRTADEYYVLVKPFLTIYPVDEDRKSVV